MTEKLLICHVHVYKIFFYEYFYIHFPEFIHKNQFPDNQFLKKVNYLLFLSQVAIVDFKDSVSFNLQISHGNGEIHIEFSIYNKIQLWWS